jgi:hypothetical protein
MMWPLFVTCALALTSEPHDNRNDDALCDKTDSASLVEGDAPTKHSFLELDSSTTEASCKYLGGEDWDAQKVLEMMNAQKCNELIEKRIVFGPKQGNRLEEQMVKSFTSTLKPVAGTSTHDLWEDVYFLAEVGARGRGREKVASQNVLKMVRLLQQELLRVACEGKFVELRQGAEQPGGIGMEEVVFAMALPPCSSFHLSADDMTSRPIKNATAANWRPPSRRSASRPS